MKKLFFALCLLGCGTFLTAQDYFPENAGVKVNNNNYTAFTNAKIFVTPTQIIEKGTLLIQHGKVVSASSSVNIPKNTVVIDLQGKSIYPSFIDVYSKFGVEQAKKKPGRGRSAEYEPSREGYYWNDHIMPETKAIEKFTYNDKEAKVLREAGFGVVNSHLQDGIARGTGVLIALNGNGTNANRILDDRSAQYFSLTKSIAKGQSYPGSLMGTLALLRQMYSDADWYAKGSATTTDLSLEALNANKNLVQIFEAKDKSHDLRADKIGDANGIQYTILGGGNEFERIEEIKATNAKYILPINFPDAYDVSNPYAVSYVSLQDMRYWNQAPTKKITTAIPSALVALIVVSGVAFGFGLDYRPIEQIPSGFPMPNLGIFSQFEIGSVTPYIFTALTLALLGAIDSLLTSVVADNMTKTKHKPNKELVGQGIGNSIAAIFGGIPGAGATIRTVVNINAGGKTKLSGMVAGVLLLVVLLALGPIASQIPAAVLAGILVTVGIGVMDYKGLKAIPSLPKDMSLGPIKFSSEVVIMLVVLVLSSVWNLVYAVGVGLVIASLMFMKKMGDLTAERSDVKSLEKEVNWPDEAAFPLSLQEEVFIKHLKGPLFFGSTSEFQQMADQIPETASTVIIRMGRMQYMDQSGLYTLEDVLISLRKSGINILFVEVLKQPRYMMERVGVIPDLIPEEHIFESFDECLAWVKSNVKDKFITS